MSQAVPTSLGASRWATSHAKQQYFQERINRSSTASNSTKLNGVTNTTTNPKTGKTTTPGSQQQPQAQLQPLSHAQKQHLAKSQDLDRFTKLQRRLKWKAAALLFCHDRALHATQSPPASLPHGHGQDDTNRPHLSLPSPREAETMFKIDFFEFYVLLERVLVHLLGAFGMVVDAETAKAPQPLPHPQPQHTAQSQNLIGDSRMFYGYSHRFHANVLAALDNPASPLHPVLGQGRVREYLGVAKEFRNRWKDVEDEKPSDVKEEEEERMRRVLKRYEKILKDLNLEEMLGCILLALEKAGGLATQELRQTGVECGVYASGEGSSRDMEMVMELDMTDDDRDHDTPWEAMPDAMEWD